MDNSKHRMASDVDPADGYQPPALTVIGDITQVVLGVPHAGYDHNGFSEPEFEFEPDGEEA